MSTTTLPPPTAALAQEKLIATRRFSVEEYLRMFERGIISPLEKMQLLEGWIFPTMPQNPAHSLVIGLAQKATLRRLPETWFPRVQMPILLADSVPEPDLAVVRGTERDFRLQHPEAQHVGTLMEVSDSTLWDDRRKQIPIYGRANIPYYWIINLVDLKVEVYSQPTGPSGQPGFRTRQDYDAHAAVPLILDGQPLGEIAVASLLP